MTEHIPARPSWLCSACGADWPCAPAKVRLTEEHADDPTALLIYLGGRMWDAIDDSTTTKPWRGPRASGMRERFLDWAMAVIGHKGGRDQPPASDGRPG